MMNFVNIFHSIKCARGRTEEASNWYNTTSRGWNNCYTGQSWCDVWKHRHKKFCSILRLITSGTRQYLDSRVIVQIAKQQHSASLKKIMQLWDTNCCVGEISTDNSTSFPHCSTIVWKVVPASRSEQNSLILRPIRSVPTSKMYHLFFYNFFCPFTKSFFCEWSLVKKGCAPLLCAWLNLLRKS
jgi:hypothetical protein